MTNDFHMSTPARSNRLVPSGLIALSIVPVIAGALRLAQLSGRAAQTPENVRFFAAPLPVVLHIFSVTIYCIFGAFQFAQAHPRRNHGWHRAAGRILVPCGLIAAVSGLWMTQFYPWPEGDGEVLYMIRIVFGSAMVVSIVFAVGAVRRHDFDSHAAWMTRGYAIGLGAGTQVLTHIPWLVVVGKPDELTRAMLMGAGWVINLLVAEWIIRRAPSRPSALPSRVASTTPSPHSFVKSRRAK